MATRKKYKTTFGFEVSVDKTEALDLRRQGLLVEDKPAPEESTDSSGNEDESRGKPGDKTSDKKGA